MNYKSILVLLTVVFLTINCSKKEEEKQTQSENTDPHSNIHKVLVDEVIQATEYTYLKVKENDDEYWVAVTRREIEVGEEYVFTQALEMKNFESKDLNKTFDRILFIQEFNSTSTMSSSMMGSAQGGMSTPQKPVLSKEELSIETAEGGITIAELYNNMEKYSDKKVKIKGKVTKVNKQIMGRNWVHIQDGTGDKNSFDLTITTDELVNNGDVVTFEGVIALNKDFGAGYSYIIIMEEAKVL